MHHNLISVTSPSVLASAKNSRGPRSKMPCFSLAAVTDFFKKAAALKIHYISYRFADPFNNREELQINSRLNLSDAREFGAEQCDFTHERRESLPDKTEHRNSSKSTKNVPRTLLNFKNMDAKSIETLDFAVLVSS